MVRKESLESLEGKEVVEITENGSNDNEFDLSVLKVDIENQEKEAQNLRNQELIKKADLQKTSETEQESTEKIQDINEIFQEVMEFILEFVNKPLKKIGITTFDEKFIEKFIKRLMDVIPKDIVSKIKDSVNVSKSGKHGIRLIKVFKFITFITKEMSKRYDEYMVYTDMKEVDGGVE